MISGPATVRMVSNNGPPIPMPMQVPPGHMVQQIVDENGILTHVILSPQPPGMMGSPLTVCTFFPPFLKMFIFQYIVLTLLCMLQRPCIRRVPLYQ